MINDVNDIKFCNLIIRRNFKKLYLMSKNEKRKKKTSIIFKNDDDDIKFLRFGIKNRN